MNTLMMEKLLIVLLVVSMAVLVILNLPANPQLVELIVPAIFVGLGLMWFVTFRRHHA